MAEKGLMFTGVMIMIVVMGISFLGWSSFFSDFNANPNYAEEVNESTLRFFNNSESIRETGETVKRQVNESSSRWSDTLGLIFEGIPSFISTLTGSFSSLTDMIGSLGNVYGIPVWFIGGIVTIISIIALGLFLRTVTNRGTI